MLTYTQLAQHRENSTSAVTAYTCPLNSTVQIFIKITNSNAVAVTCSVFHDDDGIVYDESTAIVWQTSVNPGELLEIDRVFLNNSASSIGVQTDTANAITITVYGIVRDDG